MLDGVLAPDVRGAGRGTAAERSTGFGLANTRSLVATHGGTVTVTSQVGQRSMFAVTVPRSAADG